MKVWGSPLLHSALESLMALILPGFSTQKKKHHVSCLLYRLFQRELATVNSNIGLLQLRITESARLEKTFTIIQSNHAPVTNSSH